MVYRGQRTLTSTEVGAGWGAVASRSGCRRRLGPMYAVNASEFLSALEFPGSLHFLAAEAWWDGADGVPSIGFGNRPIGRSTWTVRPAEEHGYVVSPNLVDIVRCEHEMRPPTVREPLQQRSEHVSVAETVCVGVCCASPDLGDSEVVDDARSCIMERVEGRRRAARGVVHAGGIHARDAVTTRWLGCAPLAPARAPLFKRPVLYFLRESEVS